MANNKTKNIIPIAMMFALYFMISFVTGLQNPMGVIVKEQFNVSNFLSQLCNFATFLAYLFMGVPAGMMLKRFGYRHTAQIATLVGFVGVGVAYIAGTMESFELYLVGAFISGFSMCMLNTTVNPMTNLLGGGGNRGNQYLQIGGVFNSSGATLAPILVGLLMGSASQEAKIIDAAAAMWIAMAIFACAFVVLTLVRLPEPNISATAAKEKSPLRHRHFVLGIIAIFIYVGVEVGIPNIANIYMTTSLDNGGLGLSSDLAGTMVGTYWFMMLVGRFIGAGFGARYSSKRMLRTVCATAALLVAAAMTFPPSICIASIPISIYLLVLCGLCTSVMWGNIFNLAVEGLGTSTERAAGIFMTMVFGGGVLPLLQGYIADSYGFITSYIVVILGLAYMGWYGISGYQIKK